ncbi:hypothetical protein BD626DRAFT_192488 [Schizophyllum amplum]|uniref:Defect at low temperature protein 1 n=1 Tax=Schizophyllum amplum TaxID=97359 RepID=A0A550CM29_9AGAR|nr:hypothetical protein BD626DRAFT_192488 [Auriculariopsis ampla]
MAALSRLLLQLTYFLLVLVMLMLTGLSCVALLSQAFRQDRDFKERGSEALMIIAAYLIVVIVSLALCFLRRISIRMRLSRISKVHRTLRKGDVPRSVYRYMTEEYVRTCLIAHESLPKDVVRPGWGRPGTTYEGIYYRRALLDTIPRLDALARVVIPTHPPLRPHARMLHHFRFLLPLLTTQREPSIRVGEDGVVDYGEETEEDLLTSLHYYDAAIQIARHSAEEPTMEEFEAGIQAVEDIMTTLHECEMEMFEASDTQLVAPSTIESMSSRR